jgi:hypothetical protein
MFKEAGDCLLIQSQNGLMMYSLREFGIWTK